MISAALALLVAAFAPPSDETMLAIADCLWGQLPAETRAFVQTAPDLKTLMTWPEKEEFDLEEVAATCTIADARYDVETMLPYHVAMRWLEPRLQRRWSDQSIRGAWSRLTPDEREAIYETAMGPGRHVRTDEQKVILAKLFAPFGRSDWTNDGIDELDLYLIAYVLVTQSSWPPDE